MSMRAHEGESDDTEERATNLQLAEIEEFIAEMAPTVRPDKQWYYIRVQFDTDTGGVRAKTRILHELENALDVRTVRPTASEMSSSDQLLEAIIETQLRPAALGEALDHDAVADFEYWELDAEAFELDVVDAPSSESRPVTDEFKQLQREYTESAEPVESVISEGTFEFSDPTCVSFSEDEIEFDDLLETAAERTSTDGSGPAEARHDHESLVSALAAEVATGAVDPNDIATLRDQLALPATSNSVAVRLDHVHAQMDTFAAYLDSLEAFLDEDGTAQQLLDELRTDIDDLRGDLQAAAADRDRLRAQLAELDATVATADEVDETVATLERRLETVANEQHQAIEELASRLSTVEAALEEHQHWRQRLSRAVTETDPAAPLPRES